MTATTRAAAATPRRPALDRTVAMRLAATEYGRYLDLLRTLEPSDWSRPTDCPAWDVRQMAAHNLGMAEMAASMRENLRQARAARRRGGRYLDALTALQVEERATMVPRQIVGRYAVVGPRAARNRARTPAMLRSRRMPVQPRVNDADEPWTIGFLVDVILSRDVWMHRIDTARATDRPLALTPDHDGVLVADVVAEWAQRHGAPCRLTLTGTAGGRWVLGGGGPDLELDAVEFCRTLARRAPGDGLLDVEIPF